MTEPKTQPFASDIAGRRRLLEAAQCDEAPSWRAPTRAERSPADLMEHDTDLLNDVRDTLRQSAQLQDEDDDDSAWPRFKRSTFFRKKEGGSLSLSFRRRKRPELVGNLASLDAARRNTDLGTADAPSPSSASRSAATSGSSEAVFAAAGEEPQSVLSVFARKGGGTSRSVRRQSSLSRSFRKLRPRFRASGEQTSSSDASQKGSAGSSAEIESRDGRESTTSSRGARVRRNVLSRQDQRSLRTQDRSAAAEERERVNSMWMEVDRLRKMVILERNAKSEIMQKVASVQVHFELRDSHWIRICALRGYWWTRF
jgi:hypothetical protein